MLARVHNDQCHPCHRKVRIPSLGIFRMIFSRRLYSCRIGNQR